MGRSACNSWRSPFGGSVWRHLPPAVYVGLCVLLLAGCSGPGSVKSTVKIGLSAPFEGLHRELGYEALYAVQLAVRERNEAGGVGERYLVELVALNDLNETETAVEQARKMAVDPKVLGVLGGLSAETLLVAPEYEKLGLTFLTPGADVSQLGFPSAADADAGFAAQYGLLSGGAPPGPVAAWAYAAANRLLDAMDAVAGASGHLTRSAVQDALGSIDG